MAWTGFTFMYLPGSPTAVPAGELQLFEDGLMPLNSRFGYGKGYLRRTNAVPVDPVSLPLSAKAGDEQIYEPINGLPLFGAVRDAAPDFWGRRVIEAKLQAPPDSLPESTYLLQAGRHRFGALDFRATIQEGESDGALPPIADLKYLLDAADRIQAGQPVPAQLQMLFDVGTLGGARPKVLVVHHGEQWLAKFPTKTDGFDVPVIERACLELARHCGLNVPRTDLLQLGDGRHIMLIERFDRRAIGGGEFARKHCVSALTMLGKHELQSPASSYEEIAQAISDHGANGLVIADREELYARVAFNILVSNNDDHLRNHAFVWNEQATGWQLSPLYDVVPAPQVAMERRLHLSIGPDGKSATLPNLLNAHGSFGILKPTAASIIATVSERVREWRNFFDALDVPAAESEKIASAFRRPSDIGIDRIRKELR